MGDNKNDHESNNLDSKDEGSSEGRQEEKHLLNLPAPPSPTTGHGGGGTSTMMTEKTGPKSLPLSTSLSSSQQQHRNDKKNDAVDDYNTSIEIKYANYPLVRGMILHEKARTFALEQDGTKQMFYPKSNDGWFRSVFVLEGRALDKYLLPWILVTLNAAIWTYVVEEGYINLSSSNNNNNINNDNNNNDDQNGNGGGRTSVLSEVDFSSYEIFFALVLNSSLAYLLVFRLNRSAERFWNARASWGTIVAHSRAIVNGVLVHCSNNCKSQGRSTTRREAKYVNDLEEEVENNITSMEYHRDEVIRWVAAFSVTCMHFIRGKSELYPNTLLGILNEEQIYQLEQQNHSAIHAADNIRYHLKQLFYVTYDTPISIATSYTQILDTLEQNVNGLILHLGALERIRSTPLPLVYVSHLRTFLLIFLISLPYVWENALGYATIPIVAVTAFAMLGLEGAAQEVESPFLKHRTNHLNMDSFCITLLSNITQLVTSNADREIKMSAPKRPEAAQK